MTVAFYMNAVAFFDLRAYNLQVVDYTRVRQVHYRWKQKAFRAMPKKHNEHKPLSVAAIKQGVLADPEHQTKEIVDYIEWHLNKGAKKEHKVTHLEKMKSEVVFGEEHVVWDVFTDEPGRWWVITIPTKLYSQTEFSSLDYTLSFHIGVTARVFAREAKKAPDERRDRFRSSWRQWENAAVSLDKAQEPE